MGKGKRTLRYWIGQIHLWLGMASGLVVLIVSITGCLYVFQKEISESVWKEKYFMKPTRAQGGTRGPARALDISVLLRTVQDTLGSDKPVNYITVYRQPDRSWEFMAYRENHSAFTASLRLQERTGLSMSMASRVARPFMAPMYCNSISIPVSSCTGGMIRKRTGVRSCGKEIMTCL